MTEKLIKLKKRSTEAQKAYKQGFITGLRYAKDKIEHQIDLCDEINELDFRYHLGGKKLKEWEDKNDRD